MPPPSTQHTYDPFSAYDLDGFVEKTLSHFHTPGMAIAVIHKDETFSKGYGHATLSPQTPVTPHTLFYTASTTKSFTAAAAAKLVESDEPAYSHISWHTKLSDLIPEDFVLQDKYTQDHITLEDALSHRTGMPRHDNTWFNNDASLRDQARYMRHLPLHHELRQELEYCNIMFSAVSYATLKATDKAVGSVAEGVQGVRDLLQQWFWKPLGMEATFYSLTDAQSYVEKADKGVEIAQGHYYDAKVQRCVPSPWSALQPANGAGGIISNVLDYTRWIHAFLHPCDTAPVTDATVKALTAPHMLTQQPFFLPPMHGTTAYGLGLSMATYHGVRLVGHEGSIAGYMSAMLWMPEHDWGVVIMSNAYSLAYEVVLCRLIDDFLLSLGVMEDGDRFDARGACERKETDAKERLRLDKARERLWPGAPAQPQLAPRLELADYEGLYRHAAYGELRLRVSKDEHDFSEPGSRDVLVASPTTYGLITYTFHHVNGEHWIAYERQGPGWCLVDSTAKAKFEVGVDGKVNGLGLQAETAVDDLAWFEKVV